MKNKELELEAERLYPIIPNGHPNVNWDRANKQEGFISGATSKWAKKQKLEFAIEQLKYVKQMYPCADKEEYVNVKIKEFEQKLDKL